MSEIIDIIHNLSYTITGAEGIEKVKGDFIKQAETIEKLKTQLATLNIAYANETGVKAQQNLSGAILKVTDAIEKQSVALAKQVANSKPLQDAIIRELGLVEQLKDSIIDLQHARERATTKPQLEEVNREIAAKKAELKLLLDGTGQAKEIPNIRNVGAIEAIESRLKILQNTRKTVPIENLPIIDAQIAKTKTELQSLNAVQVETTGTGDKLTSMFERMGLRFLLNLFVFQAAIQGFELLYQKTTENINGTDNYIEKQKKLTAAMESFNDILTKQVDKFGELDRAIDTYFGDGEQAYKANLDAIKAKGVVEGKVFDSQKGNFEAEKALRAEQVRGLERTEQKYSTIRRIFEDYDKFGNLGSVKKGLAELGLSPQELKDFNLELDEYLKARSKLDDKDQKNFKLSENDDLFKRQSDVQGKINDIQQKDKNAQVEYDNNIDRQVFEKRKTLQAEQRQNDETYRQLKEKEDIASVDKIARDTQAKYAAMLKAIDLDAKKTLDTVGAEAFKKLAPFFNSLRKTIRGERSQDTANQTFEFNRAQFFTEESDNAAQSGVNASQSKFAAGFGVPDYDKLAKAQDDQKQSELDAASSTFIQLREKYMQSEQDTAVIEKQYTTQVEQIEQASYSRRLQLAGEYYDKLSSAIAATAKLSLTNANTDILNGGIGLFGRSNKQQIAEGKSKVNTANLDIPLAEKALDKNNEDAINADTTDKTAVASKAALDDAQNLANARHSLAEGEKEIHDAKVDQIKQEVAAFDSLVDSTQKGYDAISQARQKDLDREISVRTQRIDMAYKLAERGNTQALAQEQKALDSAQQQKRAAAIQEQEINAALTFSRLAAAIAAAIAEDNAGALVIIPLILAAAATGFAEAQSLSTAQQAKFFKGGFTGEGGKYEAAGEVHKGEFVFDKETTTKHRQFFEAIHKGYDPFPIMAMPKQYSTSTMGINVKGIEDRLDILAGKSVSATNIVDKGGVRQIIVEGNKAHGNMWRK